MLIPDETTIELLLRSLDSKGSLSKEDRLIFVNLIHLNDRIVNALSNYRGHQISFPALESLSTLHAQALSKIECQIMLNQIQAIDCYAIESICKHKSELFMNGILSINVDESIAWSKFQGTALFLQNAKINSEEVAVHLSQINGKVYLSPNLLSQDALNVLQQKNKLYFPH